MGNRKGLSVNSPSNFFLILSFSPSLHTSNFFLVRSGRLPATALVDNAGIALEPLIGVECGSVMVVVGLSDLSATLTVRTSGAELPALVVVGKVVVEGTLGAVLVTEAGEDPGVTCACFTITVVRSVTGTAKKKLHRQK